MALYLGPLPSDLRGAAAHGLPIADLTLLYPLKTAKLELR
jgi:hypothetical protein